MIVSFFLVPCKDVVPCFWWELMVSYHLHACNMSCTMAAFKIFFFFFICVFQQFDYHVPRQIFFLVLIGFCELFIYIFVFLINIGKYPATFFLTIFTFSSFWGFCELRSLIASHGPLRLCLFWFSHFSPSSSDWAMSVDLSSSSLTLKINIFPICC